MFLSLQEQEDLVNRYDKNIRYIVREFLSRNTRGAYGFDDYYQEAMLALLAYAKECDSLEQLASVFPKRNILNAMCRLKLEEQLLTVPIRTTDYSRFMASAWIPVEYNEENVGARCSCSIEQDLEKLELDLFKSKIRDVDRRILDSLLKGRTMKQAAMDVGLSYPQARRRISAVRRLYQMEVA